MNPRTTRRLLALAAGLSALSAAQAATVTLTASNAAGATSFNTATSWSDGAAPSAANEYVVNSMLLRTPTDATNITFAGNSLTINGTAPFSATTPIAIGAASGSYALMFKGTFNTTGLTYTTTINNLTINGAFLRSAPNGTSSETGIAVFAGNRLTVGSLGMGLHAQNTVYIDAPVYGTSGIYTSPFGTDNSTTRKVVFRSGSNTFTGSLYLMSSLQTIIEMGSTSNWNFVVGANGVNNTIAGVGGKLTLNGLLNIDTSGAATTAGNTWKLIDTSKLTVTYGSTFSINGFSNVGNGLYVSADNNYEFVTSTGTLTYTGYAIDADSDGVPDTWEINYFGSTSLYDGGSDPDADGFTNAEEFSYGTNPTVRFSSPDEDSDGLPDGWEIAYFAQAGDNLINDRFAITQRCVPSADSDGDGLTNATEYAAGTNPVNALSIPGDTDGDALPDLWETTYFGSITPTPSGDFDGDGISNAAELRGGSNPADNTSVPASYTPYATDASTLHFWRFEQTALPLADSVVSGALPLAAAGNGATIGQGGFTGLGLAVNTSANRGTTTAAYIAPVALNSTDDTDVVTTAIADASTKAFTYEAIVRLDFDPSAVQSTAALSAPMQIISVEGDAANTAIVRAFQLRLLPRGTQNTGTNPLLQFINLTAGVNQTVAANLPLTGTDAAVIGGWYHVAVSFSGTPATADNLKLYWTRMIGSPTAASLLASANLSTVVVASPNSYLVIGNEGRPTGGNTDNFVGLIDEVRISSVARSATDFYFKPSLPSVPTSLAATAGNAQVSLSWTAVSGATSYTIKRATTNGGPYTTISAGAVTSAAYVDTGLTNGTTYYYVVAAVNAAGSSADSAQVSATPVSPFTALQLWRQSFFGSTANTGSGADSADADGDGLSNLLEYALGTTPTAATTNALTGGLSGARATLTFSHGADASLTYIVEASSNLTTWTTVSSQTFSSAGTTTVTDTTDVASGTPRFLRLRVTY